MVKESPKHKTITYAVQEGTLLISVGSLEQRAVVTRTLLSKKTGNNHIPLWMRDAQEQE